MTAREPEPRNGPASPGQGAGTPWHALEPAEVLRELATDGTGLSNAEAAARLARYGPNHLPTVKPRGPLRRFLAQLESLLIQILVVAALVTGLLGHWLDTAVILAVVLVNTVIGFIQEGRAEKALDAIRHMLSPTCLVTRDGHRQTLPAGQIVPGDLVHLQSGDRVPADLRLLRTKGLQIDEAALTGESVPVEKTPETSAAAAALGDRHGMAWSGTLVTRGQGSGLVVATGTATEIGRITTLLEQTQAIVTPLTRQMGQFARWLSVVIVAVAALTFGFGVTFRDYGLEQMFLAAVSIAVAAIPEGLPAILTITLAIGVQRMAARAAIIRRLPAVETLGSVSVICSDKTGTLTRNEMTVRSLVTTTGVVEVSGTGYEPRGVFSRDGRELDPDEDPPVAELLLAGLLCNDAQVRTDGPGHPRIEGDPTEAALVVAALKAGLDLRRATERMPRRDVIPFESEHRFMATLHRGHAGDGIVYLKGAPERVLEMCSQERHGAGTRELNAAAWHQQIAALAALGQRVLAVAALAVPDDKMTLDFADVDQGLTLLGLFGMLDPPREEAIAAVAECQQAGIAIKMITGDHAATALAIAGQLGLAHTARALTGPELEAMDDQALRQAVREVDVFARAAPEHKMRLVEALQANGAVVAMTGDGVNDAPALKRADVGVAMGQKGTEAAKEVAAMVLADDNFVSIARAVKEGRTVYDNLKKAILFLLPINGGESLAVLLAVLLGVTLPITPVQILWVNMVSSVVLGLSLAFEPAEPDVMRRQPRPAREPILTAGLLERILLVSALFTAGVFGMFLWIEERTGDVALARTVAVNTLVCLEVFYLFNVRYLESGSLTLRGVLGTRPVLLCIAAVTTLQLMFTYTPFMQLFFDTRALGLDILPLIFLVGVAGFALVEVEKWLRRRLRPQPSQGP